MWHLKVFTEFFPFSNFSNASMTNFAETQFVQPGLPTLTRWSWDPRNWHFSLLTLHTLSCHAVKNSEKTKQIDLNRDLKLLTWWIVTPLQQNTPVLKQNLACRVTVCCLPTLQINNFLVEDPQIPWLGLVSFLWCLDVASTLINHTHSSLTVIIDSAFHLYML